MPVGDGDEDDVPEFAWHVRDNALAMVSASGKSGSLKLWVAGDRRPPDDRFLVNTYQTCEYVSFLTTVQEGAIASYSNS